MDNHRLTHLEPSDEALVERAAHRDLAAFTLLYDRYAHLVYSLAAHTLGNAHAEEVVQEVFLRLWHNADQFDGERSRFRIWFMAIARHRVLDELRRRGQQQRLVVAERIDQVLAEAVDPAADVEEEAWRRARSEAVLCALQSLPAEQRRVLVLAYFGGLSQSAIAHHLGWPLGTVKKRVRLGLQKLRAALTQQGLASDSQTGSTPSDAR